MMANEQNQLGSVTMFQVTDHIRMKSNLRKIDTYGISPGIILMHRKTILWVSEVLEYVGGESALRINEYAKIYDKKQRKYVDTKVEFHMAYLNPEMFEKVEVVNDGRKVIKIL